MRVRVRFRVNTETGEVERFLVEDIGSRREADHEAVHDRIAHEVGKVVDRRPAPEQVVGAESGAETVLTYRPDELAVPERHGEEARE